MYNINIICVGKLKEDYLRGACAEYSKRMQAFANLKVVEIDECRLSDKPSQKEINNALETEAKSTCIFQDRFSFCFKSIVYFLL